ncbi:succinate dehydrogenase cytochrome b subunit [bacterium]|jgi:succinate dehydrogenase / fumarate reductase, cytochrome b subunit|nr:succinate dehydrogenase cytochrome b subunit [bacterium]
MLPIKQYFASSIGKKQIAALTGLMLSAFVVIHLLENFLLFKGPDVFNAWVNTLQSTKPFLYVIEFGLLGIFLLHLFTTFKIVVENKRARKKGYREEVATKILVKIMPISGTALLIFIIFHLIDFRFTNHHGAASIVMGEDLGLYGLVYNYFQNIFRVIGYCIGLAALGCHLSHAIQSVFQTFGIFSEKYNHLIKKTSVGLATGLMLGFSAIAILIYLGFAPTA